MHVLSFHQSSEGMKEAERLGVAADGGWCGLVIRALPRAGSGGTASTPQMIDESTRVEVRNDDGEGIPSPDDPVMEEDGEG